MSTDPAINHDELLERVDNDTELLRDLVELFLDDLQERLDGIDDAIKQDDLNLLHECAHALKGSVANFAASAALEAATRLTEMAREGRCDGLGEAVQALNAEMKRVRTELEKIVASA
jgi:HPt (histidine-containing phosphotransfer) domain-containing protein